MLKAAVGGPSRDSLFTVRARARRVGRPAAGQFQASMSRIKNPGSAWRLLVSSGSAGRGLTSTRITAVSPGSAARSEARTAAHRFTPSGSGTPSSWTGSSPYPYAEMGIFPSRMSMHRMAYSLTARGLCRGSPRSIFIVPIRNQILPSMCRSITRGALAGCAQIIHDRESLKAAPSIWRIH